MKNLREQVRMLTRLVLTEDPVERQILQRKLAKTESLMVIPESLDAALTELGIPDYTKGYRMMVRAIQIQMEHKDPVSFGGLLYPKLGGEFECNPKRAERVLRNCVDACFARADWEIIQKYFGSSIDPVKGKATVRQFIVRMANLMREAA